MSFSRRLVVVVCIGLLIVFTGVTVSEAAKQDPGPASCKQVLRDRFDELHQDWTPLGEAEEASIMTLWLEEYLAYEVYRAFQAEYCDSLLEIEDTCLFANLANAEKQHQKLVEKLIKAYGLAIPEPPADEAWWEERYWALVEGMGSTFLGALQAGVLVESDELCALGDTLSWSHPDVNGELWDEVALVAQNVAAGERNHLRALVKAIEGQNGEYVVDCPSIDVEAILAGEMERRIVYDADGEVLAECGNGRGGGKK